MEKNKYEEDNPLTRRQEEEINNCSAEQKKKLEKLNKMSWKEYSLLRIKKKKIMPKQGDVFLLSPQKNMYLYGVVVQEKPALIDNDDYYVILILKDPIVSELTDYIPKLDLYNVIIEPQIVMDIFWKRGYFYNIGSLEIPENLDFGFYDVREPEGFIDKNGNPTEKVPTIWGGYWFVSIDGLGRKLNRGLIISKLDKNFWYKI